MLVFRPLRSCDNDLRAEIIILLTSLPFFPRSRVKVIKQVLSLKNDEEKKRKGGGITWLKTRLM